MVLAIIRDISKFRMSVAVEKKHRQSGSAFLRIGFLPRCAGGEKTPQTAGIPGDCLRRVAFRTHSAYDVTDVRCKFTIWASLGELRATNALQISRTQEQIFEISRQFRMSVAAEKNLSRRSGSAFLKIRLCLCWVWVPFTCPVRR